MSDRPRYSEISVRDAGPEFEYGPLTRTNFVRYAGASGDFNPMHHDETFAQGVGLPSVFGHGMFTAGVLSRAIVDWVGVENVRSYGCRFTSRVWPGDVLTCKITVADKLDDNLAELDAKVENQDGEVVLTGTATVKLAD